MKVVTRDRIWPHLISVGAAIGLFVPNGQVCAQDKKDGKPFRSAVVELTDKAPSDWLLREAKVGNRMVSARDYTISNLPDEVKGGTFLLRTAGDDHKEWLPDRTVRALKDGTVYALVRWKYLGKEVMDEVAVEKLEREGWTEVKGTTSTTFPGGEDWQWRTYKKEIKKGDVVLQLKALKWGGWAVLFVFQ